MTLCENCGRLSFYDPYFKKYICQSCYHRQAGAISAKKKYMLAKNANERVMESRMKVAVR